MRFPTSPRRRAQNHERREIRRLRAEIRANRLAIMRNYRKVAILATILSDLAFRV